jgi:hypothetical protein
MRAFLGGLVIAAILMAGGVFLYLGASVPVEYRYSPQDAVRLHETGERSAMDDSSGGDEATQQARK